MALTSLSWSLPELHRSMLVSSSVADMPIAGRGCHWSVHQPVDWLSSLMLTLSHQSGSPWRSLVCVWPCWPHQRWSCHWPLAWLPSLTTVLSHRHELPDGLDSWLNLAVISGPALLTSLRDCGMGPGCRKTLPCQPRDHTWVYRGQTDLHPPWHLRCSRKPLLNYFSYCEGHWIQFIHHKCLNAVFLEGSCHHGFSSWGKGSFSVARVVSTQVLPNQEKIRFQITVGWCVFASFTSVSEIYEFRCFSYSLILQCLSNRLHWQYLYVCIKQHIKNLVGWSTGFFPWKHLFPIAEVSTQHLDFQAIVKESLPIIFIKDRFFSRDDGIIPSEPSKLFLTDPDKIFLKKCDTLIISQNFYLEKEKLLR